MKRTLLYTSELPEVTEEMRKEFAENFGNDFTDDEVADWNRERLSDFLDNIKFSGKDKSGESIADCSVVITGKVGVWNGVHDIRPIVANNIEDAIERVIVNGDCSLSIYKQASKIIVEVGHHDGTNVFVMRFLNGYGEFKKGEGLDLNYQNPIYTRTLGKYLF